MATRVSIAPEYWKYSFQKLLEHEKSVLDKLGSMFAFKNSAWNFSKVNDMASVNDENVKQYADGGLLAFLNWKDRCEENAPPVKIFNNDFWISHNYLPAFQETNLFPNGVADAKRMRDWAEEADYWAMVLRQYEWRWAHYGGPRGEYRAEWNPKGQNCIDKIAEAHKKMWDYSRQLRQNDNNNPFRWPAESGVSYSNSPYEKMFVDRGDWNGSPEYYPLKLLRNQLIESYNKRSGFISDAELWGAIGKGMSIIGNVAGAIQKVGLVVGAAVTGGALATAIAPTIGGAIGISTGVVQTGLTGAAVGAVTGDPLAALSPVLKGIGGNLLKSVTPGAVSLLPGGTVGLFDDIQKAATSTLASIGTVPIGDTLARLSNGLALPTPTSLLADAQKAVSQLTPAQIAAAVSSQPANSATVTPVASKPPSPEVIAAGVGGGAILLLALIFLLSQKKG